MVFDDFQTNLSKQGFAFFLFFVVGGSIGSMIDISWDVLFLFWSS